MPDNPSNGIPATIVKSADWKDGARGAWTLMRGVKADGKQIVGGVPVDKQVFFSMMCFGDVADKVLHLQPGQKVRVFGRWQSNPWTNAQGVVEQQLSCVVERVEEVEEVEEVGQARGAAGVRQILEGQRAAS